MEKYSTHEWRAFQEHSGSWPGVVSGRAPRLDCLFLAGMETAVR